MSAAPDLIVTGGRVFDGSGAPGTVTDVAIGDGRILGTGDFRAVRAPRLEATGLTVAPGFIDIHSHSDYTLLVDPRAVSSITQGVTTEVIGNCGHGCFPLRDPTLARQSIYGITDHVALDWTGPAAYLERLEQARPAVNVLTLVPNGQLRLSAVGLESRPADRGELATMQALLEEGLEAGAWGYSTGLEYAVEMGAGEDEIVALCRTVARHDALYATHTRYRDQGSVEAVEEALRTGARAGVRLQISHLLPRSGTDDCKRCIERVQTAADAGQDVAFDMHTRMFGLTFLHAMLPPWALAGGTAATATHLAEAAARRRILAHRSIITASGNWRRVVLLDNDIAPEYARRNFEEIGAMRDQPPGEAALDLLARGLDAPRPLMAISLCYDEGDQALAFGHPLCMPGGDATALAPDGPLADSAFHGAYSWAAWFFAFAVRRARLLDEAEAIHRLTGAPATRMGLTDRGLIRPGYRADLAIFDAARLEETATVHEPNQPAGGMHHVLVNGIPTLKSGALTGRRAGQVLRRR